jgi:HK97 family phage prohead protease
MGKARTVDQQLERRIVSRPLRADTREERRTIEGYAALTDTETVIDLGFFGFREMIAPGAFREAITTSDVRALFNHDPNFVLGRNTSGTLRLSEDDEGLRYVVDLPETRTADEVLTLIKRGDVSGSSFAFRVDEKDDEWDESEVAKGKLPLRIIHRVSELYDVSPVTYPAYPDTSVSARATSRLAALAGEAAASRARAARAALRTQLDAAWRRSR